MSDAPIEDGLAFVRQAREDLTEQGLPMFPSILDAYLAGFIAGCCRQAVTHWIAEAYEGE